MIGGITTTLPSAVVRFDAAVHTLVDFKMILAAKSFATLQLKLIEFGWADIMCFLIMLRTVATWPN